ncbi:hypothetical protein E2P81_ATG07036 [Venturia nashicola]|uniref:Uncharacterized protein n=1 Tax=Venturia nashicola TaxID=86259 RepID=A0A4Z1NF55_9PEZI|nr:hypothetical protein E6O75_ATG07201 [Venturia nashicola]TLD19419.1 hypothetical protein E2P81_ATG07036 [Venturia nashicola]
MWTVLGPLEQRAPTPENTLPSCAIDGTSDLYGLGIRLSIYVQYLTILVAAVSGRRLYSKIRTAVLIYAVAILVVVFRNSISGKLYALEVPIIQLLVLVQLSAVLPTVWVISPVGWLIYMALAANSAYFVWYWFRGLDKLKRSNCADEYAWFFAKVSLYQWYRTFNKVFACFGIIGVLYQISAVGGIAAADNVDQTNHVGNVWGLLPTIPFTIAACEMAIKWNGIKKVNSIDSTGQLIPLVLSIGQLLHFLYSGVRRVVNDEDDDTLA